MRTHINEEIVVNCHTSHAIVVNHARPPVCRWLASTKLGENLTWPAVAKKIFTWHATPNYISIYRGKWPQTYNKTSKQERINNENGTRVQSIRELSWISFRGKIETFQISFVLSFFFIIRLLIIKYRSRRVVRGGKKHQAFDLTEWPRRRFIAENWSAAK